MYKKIFAFPFLVLSLSSCAAMISGSTDDVKITSNPPGANCSADNTRSQGQITTPGTVTVKRSFKYMYVNCTLPNYGTGQKEVRPGANFWTLLNIFNFGLGYIYDVAAGPVWNYPEEVQVPLQPSGATFNGNFMMKPGSSGVTPVGTNMPGIPNVPGSNYGTYAGGYNTNTTVGAVAAPQAATNVQPYSYPAQQTGSAPAQGYYVYQGQPQQNPYATPQTTTPAQSAGQYQSGASPQEIQNIQQRYNLNIPNQMPAQQQQVPNQQQLMQQMMMERKQITDQ